ncbi:MAG: class I SAM-dependent methyltransferase [Elusimicrobiota bacterium]
MTRVRSDWWKDYFNSVYLLSDSRSVLDAEVTRRETDWLKDVVRPRKSDSILDLCGGQGRHAFEMSRRGFKDLTVLDYSSYLIRLGRKLSRKNGRGVRFVVGDARKTPLPGDAFDVVLLMTNSFGYFSDDRDNVRILKEARRLLKRGGKLFLDLTDRERFIRSFKPLSWHEAEGDVVVCRKREMGRRVVTVRELVVSSKRGLLRDGRYKMRVFAKGEILRMLREARLRPMSVSHPGVLHERRGDYGLMNNRLSVLALRA